MVQSPENPDGAPPPKRRRRGRWLSRLLVAPFVLVGLLVALVAVLPVLYPGSRVKQAATRALRDALGVASEIDDLDYHPFEGLEIEAFRVGPPAGFTEDVLVADRLTVRYEPTAALFGEVVVDEVSLLRPTLVLEVQDGRLNLAALFADLGGPADAPPAPSSLPDRQSPLLPLIIRARRVSIEDLTLRLIGAGTDLTIGGIGIEVDGDAGPDQIRLHLGATIAGRLDLARDPVALRSSIELVLSATIAADASRGLSIERVALAVAVAAKETTLRTESSLAPMDIAARLAVRASATEDTASVDQLDLILDDTPLLGGAAGVTGLHDLLVTTIGAAATASVAAYVGLVAGAPAVVEAQLARRKVALAAVSPLLGMLVPGLHLDGALGVGPVVLASPLSSLLALRPPKLDAAIDLDGVQASLPGGVVRIGPVHGAVAVRTSTDARARLDADLTVARLDLGPTRLAGVASALTAEVVDVDAQGHGRLQASLQARLGSLAVDRLKLYDAEADVAVSGLDVLDPGRPVDAPIAVRIAASAGGLDVGTSSGATHLETLAVVLKTQVDRIWQPARRRFNTSVDARAGRITLGPLSISDASVRGRLTTADPRAAAVLSPTADLVARAGTLQLGHRRTGRQSRCPPGGAASTHPAIGAGPCQALGPGRSSKRPDPFVVARSARLDLKSGVGGLAGLLSGDLRLERLAVAGELVLPAVELDYEVTGEVHTSLRSSFDASAELRSRAVTVRALHVDVDDTLALTLSGHAEGLGRPSPTVDLISTVGPLDLARAVARMPPVFAAAVPGLTASGTVTVQLQVDGTLPAFDGPPDLTRLPGGAFVGVKLEDVHASVPTIGLHAEAVTSTVDLDLKPGRVGLVTHTEIGAVNQQLRSGTLSGRQMLVQTNTGLADGVWSTRARLEAETLSAGLNTVRTASAASADLHMVYPRGGELELRRLRLHVPDSGVVAKVQGRLQRGPDRAFVPTIDGTARLDLDRLRVLLPFIGAAAGKVRAEIGVAPRGDGVLELSGLMGVEGLSYASPRLLLLDAHGRVPLSQQVALPQSTTSAAEPGVVERMMDDDVVPRLLDLLGLLTGGARLVVDAEDVLTEAPRTADYELLRPYYAKDARLWARELVIGGLRVSAMSVDALYRSGVIRLDRFAGQLWEGDVFGDLAIQLAGEDDVRARMRLTVTDLNIDIPTAPLLRIPRADPSDRELYLVSGIADLRVKVSRRSINGGVDIAMGAETIVRLIDAIDPAGEDEQLQSIRSQLASILEGVLPFVFGEALSGARIWISQNLLNQTFVWDRPWFSYNPLVPLFRLIQEVSGSLSELFAGRRWEPTLVNLVPEIRRRNLAEIWEFGGWAWLIDLFSPLAGQIVVADLAGSAPASTASAQPAVAPPPDQ